MSVAHHQIRPATALMQTEAGRQDQVLSWNRPDDAFFAAGACHVLAFRFLAYHPNEGTESFTFQHDQFL